MTLEGTQFAVDQITAGITAFGSVLSGELDPFLEMLPGHQVEDEEDEDEDMMVEDGVDEDDVEGLVEENLPSDTREERDETGDVVLDAFAAIPVDLIDPISSVQIGSATSCWSLPSGISQGRYNGRNGSSACSLIAFFIAYAISKNKIEIPAHPIDLPRNIVHVLCRCMELGNRVYEMCRDSLPSRYLSIQEAASVLEPWIHSAVGDSLPVRLEDEHELTTVYGQLKQATSSSESGVALVVINEKSSLFHFANNRIMYIDTHSHHACGAIVMAATIQNLEEFCRLVWEVESHDQNTFGNLVYANF